MTALVLDHFALLGQPRDPVSAGRARAGWRWSWPASCCCGVSGAGVVDIAAVRARLRSGPLTRFAPAPTGYLHLGHVVNAIHVWGLAAALGGRVLLRIEDHDRQRCRPEYEAAILDDLDWLGFVADVFPTAAFRAGRCDGRQSDREAVYRAAVEGLAARGLVYGCRCTRREIEAAGTGRGGRTAISRHLPPAGTAARRHASAGGSSSNPARWRSTTRCTARPPRSRPTQCGDVLIRDRLGNWTYQFAVSVDDTAQGIDLVVRGDDLFTVDRPADPARPAARALAAAAVRAPCPGDEVVDAEAQQERRRHRRARPARGRVVAAARARRRGAGGRPPRCASRSRHRRAGRRRRPAQPDAATLECLRDRHGTIRCETMRRQPCKT